MLEENWNLTSNNQLSYKNLPKKAEENINWGINITYSLLIGILTIFFLSFIGFIFHLNINIIFPIIGIITTYITLFLLLKNQDSSKENIVISFLIITSILLISLFLSGNIYDSSWDGRTYHQLSIILLGNGWNPIFDNVNQFATNFFGVEPKHLIWVENYPKFVEIISANILVLTKHIECGKMLNLLSLTMVFCYSNYIFSKKIFANVNKNLKIFLSFLLVYNPIVIAQISTYYTDITLYCYFIMALLAIIDIETRIKTSKLSFSILAMSLIILININFFGILYSITPIVIYYLYLIVYRKDKKLKALGAVVLFTLIFGLLSGINPYFTNIEQQRNPFYPIAGKGSIDIMTSSTPQQLEGSNIFYNFFMSTFSKVDNMSDENRTEELQLKLPFTIYQGELEQLAFPDTRVSGFGVFWSGILALSVIMSVFIRYRSIDTKIISLLMYSIILVSIISNPYNWWARYISYLWALPIFINLFLLSDRKQSIKVRTISYFILIMMFVNSTVTTISVFKGGEDYHRTMNKIFNNIPPNTIVKLYGTEEASFAQKLIERKIPYKFIMTRRIKTLLCN